MSSVLSDDFQCQLTPKVLEIATDDDPYLKIVAKEIHESDIGSDKIQQLIVDMVATMHSAKGIGLAAPQIRQSVRVMVFYLPAERDQTNKTGVPLTILINPTVTYIRDSPCNNKEGSSNSDINVDYEGCLSVPGKRGKVWRYNKITYSGWDHKGERIENRSAEGWHARVVQHEFDHLNGVLYTDFMREEDELLTLEAYSALQEQEKEREK